MSKYYYHGTNKSSFYKIIETGEIKCRRLIDEENIQAERIIENTLGAGCNGNEYISVCNKNDYFDDEDSFNVFIRNSFCFIISDDIEAIKTVNIHDKNYFSQYKDEFNKFVTNNGDSSLRFSIMPDEYHVKTSIPLSKIIGIGFPFSRLTSKEIEFLFDLSYELKLDVVDTGDPYFVEKYESLKTKIKKKIV